MYNLQPGVYNLVQFEKNYILAPSIAKFELPSKLYGDMESNAIRFWTTFATSTTSLGVMLTGQSGTGKTELAKVLSNIAISAGLPVVVVTDLKATIETVNFLNNLKDVIILFDEYSKNFDSNLQDKMLTMFSSINGYKKMYIITENDKNTISRFIRNRPGRVLYHIDYSRVKEDVIIEYCADKKVDEAFGSELLKLYAKSTIFSFDHMQALVGEHLRYPNDTLEDILSLLNLEILTKEIKITLRRVINQAGESLEFRPLSFDVSVWEKGRPLWVWVTTLKDDIAITVKSVVDIKDNIITCKDPSGITFVLSKDTNGYNEEDQHLLPVNATPSIQNLFAQGI